MTRLLLEQDGVVISTDTPVITYNPDPIDEYIVIVNDASDWQEIHDYIINDNEIDGIPNRKNKLLKSSGIFFQILRL